MNKTLASSMMASLAALALVAALGSTTVLAGTRLDDSASPRALVQAPNMVSEYGYPVNQYVPGAPVAQRGIVDFGRIEYRLATAPYVGRHARIYFVIPPAVIGLRSPQGLQVSWRSEGNFASGSGRPGDKVQVWSGWVRDAFMSEAIALRMEFALREMNVQASKGISLECFFEIEVGP